MPVTFVSCHCHYRSIMMKLKNGSKRVAGVAVVAPNVNPPMGFSPHTSCPNENMGRYTQIVLVYWLENCFYNSVYKMILHWAISHFCIVSFAFSTLVDPFNSCYLDWLQPSLSKLNINVHCDSYENVKTDPEISSLGCCHHHTNKKN